MKKNILLLIIFLALHHATFAQATEDSIKARLKKFSLSKKDEAAKLQLFIDLSNDYRRHNYDSSIFYARKAVQLAKQTGAKEQAYQAQGALEFSLRETGNLAEALNIELHLLDEARFGSEKMRLTYALELNSVGNTYLEMGDAKTALAYYRESRSIFLLQPDSAGPQIADNLNMAGYFKRNEASNIGNAFEIMGQPDSALKYEMAMYRDKRFPPDLMPELLSRLGQLRIRLGNDKEAMQLFRRGVALSFAQNTINDRATIYYQMAILFNKWGQTDSSLHYAQRSFFTARSIALGKVALKASLLIADLYHKSLRLDSAYEYQRKAIQYNDALFGAEKFRKIQLVLSQEQQRQQKLLQDQQQQKNSYRLIGGIVVILFVLAVALLIWRNNQKQKQTNLLLSEQKEEIAAQRDNLALTLNELKATQAQLIQSEKMASLGELTAGIAHEIQNPLNFVNNFSEVNREMIEELRTELRSGNLEEALAIVADIEQNEEKITHHGKRADGIVKGMLQHSRASSGTKESTDLNGLVDEYLRLAYHGLRAKDKSFNAELVTHFDEKLPKVNIIPQDIGRVMLNLFTNAFYAVQQKQKTAAADYKPTVEVSTKINGQLVIIKVKDNGTGILDEIKDKIIQPFFTTKPTGEGTGLGLSLSYDTIVKGHGGSIDIQSIVNDYTEFTVRIPA